MINSITFGEKFIHLFSDDYFSSGFFDVDSISLLIGKNGTGKTKMLRKIASRIINPNAISLEDEIDINYSSGIEEYVDWGCVYFSPVKNSFAGIKRRTRYEDASLSNTKRVKIRPTMSTTTKRTRIK